MGLTPDSEPTAQDMKKINNFVKEHQVKYIFFEELVSDKLAKTLANDLKIETLVLNPLEGLTDAQMKAGEDYFSIMEKNLQNLVKALQ
ncbi:High-affinity zinc uptake system binding-protein ZnuA precursor [compost metagenome]